MEEKTIDKICTCIVLVSLIVIALACVSMATTENNEQSDPYSYTVSEINRCGGKVNNEVISGTEHFKSSTNTYTYISPTGQINTTSNYQGLTYTINNIVYNLSKSEMVRSHTMLESTNHDIVIIYYTIKITQTYDTTTHTLINAVNSGKIISSKVYVPYTSLTSIAIKY